MITEGYKLSESDLSEIKFIIKGIINPFSLKNFGFYEIVTYDENKGCINGKKLI